MARVARKILGCWYYPPRPRHSNEISGTSTICRCLPIVKGWVPARYLVHTIHFDLQHGYHVSFWRWKDTHHRGLPVLALLSPLLASAESTLQSWHVCSKMGAWHVQASTSNYCRSIRRQFFAMILMLSSYKYSASNNRKWPFHYRYQACRRAWRLTNCCCQSPRAPGAKIRRKAIFIHPSKRPNGLHA